MSDFLVISNGKFQYITSETIENKIREIRM